MLKRLLIKLRSQPARFPSSGVTAPWGGNLPARAPGILPEPGEIVTDSGHKYQGKFATAVLPWGKNVLYSKILSFLLFRCEIKRCRTLRCGLEWVRLRGEGASAPRRAEAGPGRRVRLPRLPRLLSWLLLVNRLFIERFVLHSKTPTSPSRKPSGHRVTSPLHPASRPLPFPPPPPLWSPAVLTGDQGWARIEPESPQARTRVFPKCGMPVAPGQKPGHSP